MDFKKFPNNILSKDQSQMFQNLAKALFILFGFIFDFWWKNCLFVATICRQHIEAQNDNYFIIASFFFTSRNFFYNLNINSIQHAFAYSLQPLQIHNPNFNTFSIIPEVSCLHPDEEYKVVKIKDLWQQNKNIQPCVVCKILGCIAVPFN